MLYNQSGNRSQAGVVDLLQANEKKPTLTKDEAMDLIHSRASSGDRGRDPVHLALQKQWFVNVAEYIGLNGYDGVESILNLDPNFVPDNEIDNGYTANLIFRFVMYQNALLTSGTANMSVMPKSRDLDDELGAQVGEFFLAHYDDELNFRRIRRELAFWMTTCGNAFCRTDWNARIGERMETFFNPFNKELSYGSDIPEEDKQLARDVGAVEQRFTGRMEMEVLSPFQVVVPQGFYGRLEDMPWVMLEYERSIDWVWDHYPKAAPEIGPDDLDSSTDGQYWRRLPSLVATHGFLLPSMGAEGNETVRVYEMWIPPSGRFPKGHWIRSLRSTYLDHGPHPYAEAGVNLYEQPWMKYPVTHFRYAPVPGRFWSMGLVEHLRGPQQDYNRARHQSILQRDRLGQPQIIAPMGTKWDSLRNEVGDILEYRTALGYGKPDILPPPPVSSMVVESMDRAMSDMRIISAQGEAVQGNVPTGMRSGVALRALQEKDNMTISSTIQELEEGFEQTSIRLLTLTHLFQDTDRMVQIYGEDRGGDTQIFKGSDLHGNVFVRIRPGSMMPKSKAEQMELMFQAIQAGIVNPMDPDHLELIYKSIDVDGSENLFKQRNLARRRAKHENYMFAKPPIDPETGEQRPYPQVMPYDDHMEHLKAHEEFMLKDSYEQLPEFRKIAFEGHLRMHRDELTRQMEAQQMIAQAMSGGDGGSPPAEKGEASPPAEKQPTPGTEVPA